MGEDWLTEFLAYVLNTDPDARDALGVLLHLPRYREGSVTTQLPLLNGRRVDLELQLQDDTAWHVVWIEAKIDAEEQPNQLLDYRTELLRRYGTRGSLVALGKDGSEILTTALERHVIPPLREPTQLAEPVSWQQLSRAFDHVGADRAGGARWRRDANQAATPTVQRTLHDFLHYLQGRGLAMNDDPLTLTDGLVASRGPELFDKRDGLISRLLSLAAGRITDPVGDVSGAWYWPGVGDFCSSQGRFWSLGN